MNRLRVIIRGAVQGVGFRPFVHRLALDLSLNGWVRNTPEGVLTEVEGCDARLQDFLVRLPREAPPRSVIQGLEPSWLPGQGHRGFAIRSSEQGGERATLILPDIATCPDCRREIFESSDRRYRYPFTNCTHCGPRFSIIEALPYDRARTTLKVFSMCAACQAEYDDPTDRRFHAQPNACPMCGPQLAWWDATGRALAHGDAALDASLAALGEGAIVAVKGLGGYHLMVLARDETAVRRLRERKRRPDKPFALMVPHVEYARQCCAVDFLEQRLLESPEAPIVLLDRRACETSAQRKIMAEAVAPEVPRLGLMLPATPLHHLMLADLGEAVVATSGNRGDEPICHEESEALDRLRGIADYFLVHDRPIRRPVDDSIVMVMAGRPMVLRRARGYAPWPLPNGSSWSESPPGNALSDRPTVLAMGGHLKSTVAWHHGSQVFLSQYLGDLDNVPARHRYQKALADLESLWEAHPEVVAVDAHPDYASTCFAEERFSGRDGISRVRVQHHHAHALACLAEHDLAPSVLAVVWDGAGYGLDGTIWGGEFLCLHPRGFERVAHLRTFRLPGGDIAAREPRRAALGWLWEIFGPQALHQSDLASVRAFTAAERKIVGRAIERGLQSPWTSSAGRLFDAVASLMEVRQISSFEGQAALALECLAEKAAHCGEVYEMEISDEIVNWEPLLHALLRDIRTGVAPAVMAAKVHNTLVESMVAVANRVGLEHVILTGGCFQNRFLLNRAVSRLREQGFQPVWPQGVPPNDGGIALGQIVAAQQISNMNA